MPVVISPLQNRVGFQLWCDECEKILLSRDQTSKSATVRVVALTDLANRHRCNGSRLPS